MTSSTTPSLLSPYTTSRSPPLCLHIEITRLWLFKFLSLADSSRLLATCRTLRHDAGNVEMLLKQFPVTNVVFQSRSLSPNGCFPTEIPQCLDGLACASAMSIASWWEQRILPMCYKWHSGHRVSLRVEPFILQLPRAAESILDVRDSLNDVCKGLGDAYASSSKSPPIPCLSWNLSDDRIEDCAMKSTMTHRRHSLDNRDALMGWFGHAPNPEAEDSDWDDSESETDCETESEEEQPGFSTVQARETQTKMPKMERGLCSKVLGPIRSAFQAANMDLARWVVVPIRDGVFCNSVEHHLVVGVSPTRTVAGGVLVKIREE